MQDALQKTICIVDDDDAVRDSMKTMLETFGMAVREFASPHEFLDGFGYRDCICLVLDLHMPVMSGLELLETLKERNIGVPAVMVTGRPEPQIADRLKSAGLSTLLAKPFSPDDLLEGIAGAIANTNLKPH